MKKHILSNFCKKTKKVPAPDTFIAIASKKAPTKLTEAREASDADCF